jgi:hypothetical protein
VWNRQAKLGIQHTMPHIKQSPNRPVGAMWAQCGLCKPQTHQQVQLCCELDIYAHLATTTSACRLPHTSW